MNPRVPLRGIIPPLILPIAPDGSLDFTSLHRHATFLLDGGVHGLWVNGTSGDFHALDTAERQAVVSEVVKAAQGRVPVIAQVGDAATRRALAHAEAAAAAGADYISAIAPYYLDYSQAELLCYYRELAATSSLPLVIYQLPKMAKVGLTVDSVLELAREGHVVAIKDSAGDMSWYRQLLARTRAEGIDLRCFVGGGGLVDISLLAGGHGAMCVIANLLPRHCIAIYEAAVAGDWSTAAACQAEVQIVIDALALPTRSNWAASIAVIKWALKDLGVIASDAVASPLMPLTPQEEAYLRQRALELVCRLEPGFTAKER